MSEAQLENSHFERGLKFGLFLIFGILIIAVLTYLYTFDAGLSKSADNWSAFGSFFGGVFGPIISIVTLFALLRTIELQKELLNTQRREFEALSTLQRGSNDTQVDQVRFSKLSDYKSHQLQLLDQQITMFERMHDRYNKDIEQLTSRQDFLNLNLGQLRDITSALEETDRAASQLAKLSIEISLTSYDSVEQLRFQVSKKLATIHPYYSHLIDIEPTIE